MTADAAAYALVACWAALVLATAARETRRTERALERLEREAREDGSTRIAHGRGVTDAEKLARIRSAWCATHGGRVRIGALCAVMHEEFGDDDGCDDRLVRSGDQGQESDNDVRRPLG